MQAVSVGKSAAAKAPQPLGGKGKPAGGLSVLAPRTPVNKPKSSGALPWPLPDTDWRPVRGGGICRMRSGCALPTGFSTPCGALAGPVGRRILVCGVVEERCTSKWLAQSPFAFVSRWRCEPGLHRWCWASGVGCCQQPGQGQGGRQGRAEGKGVQLAAFLQPATHAFFGIVGGGPAKPS